MSHVLDVCVWLSDGHREYVTNFHNMSMSQDHVWRALGEERQEDTPSERP